jgi:hypothetical protein
MRFATPPPDFRYLPRQRLPIYQQFDILVQIVAQRILS